MLNVPFIDYPIWNSPIHVVLYISKWWYPISCFGIYPSLIPRLHNPTTTTTIPNVFRKKRKQHHFEHHHPTIAFKSPPSTRNMSDVLQWAAQLVHQMKKTMSRWAFTESDVSFRPLLKRWFLVTPYCIILLLIIIIIIRLPLLFSSRLISICTFIKSS